MTIHCISLLLYLAAFSSQFLSFAGLESHHEKPEVTTHSFMLKSLHLCHSQLMHKATIPEMITYLKFHKLCLKQEWEFCNYPHVIKDRGPRMYIWNYPCLEGWLPILDEKRRVYAICTFPTLNVNLTFIHFAIRDSLGRCYHQWVKVSSIHDSNKCLIID